MSHKVLLSNAEVAVRSLLTGDNDNCLSSSVLLIGDTQTMEMFNMSKKFHTVYKITNNINGKIYIGKHSTDNLDDGYMGSGSYIRNAILKYGVESFNKEILCVLDTSEGALIKESEIVNEAFVSRKDTYNMRVGGDGGFTSEDNKRIWSNRTEEQRQKIISYLCRDPLIHSISAKKYYNSPEGKARARRAIIRYNKSEKGRNTSKRSAENMRSLLNNYKQNNPDKYHLSDLKRRLGSCHRNHKYYNHSDSIWDCSKCRDLFINIFNEISLLDNQYLLNKYKENYENIK